jgi:hypothetical protein
MVTYLARSPTSTTMTWTAACSLCSKFRFVAFHIFYACHTFVYRNGTEIIISSTKKLNSHLSLRTKIRYKRQRRNEVT